MPQITSKKQTTPHIRWAIPRDMPTLLAIENACFICPWSEEEFLGYLRQKNVTAQAAEVDGNVLGFMVYELHKDRITIINLAVHPKRWREGIGSALLQHLKNKTKHEARNRVDSWVAESKTGAHLFFKANNVRCEATHREYFDDGQDAYYFVWKKPPAEPV